MLNPSDSIVDWVLKTVPTMGAGWCPPGMLGIGIGGTAEKAMLLAKEALMEPIDMFDLLKRAGRRTIEEELRIELYEKVNALGIGAQGLGGLTTVLDVKIKLDYPTTPPAKPVAMIPNCAATRHAHFVLDGSGPAYWSRRAWTCGPRSPGRPTTTKKVDLDTLTREEVPAGSPATAAAQRQDADRPRRRAQAHPGHAGQGREAAGRFHQPRHLLRRPGRSGARRGGRPGRPDHRHAHGQVHRDDAGQTGLIAMIGKAERGPVAIEAIRKHKAPT
jgi:fumarate hydratase, class I